MSSGGLLPVGPIALPDPQTLPEISLGKLLSLARIDPPPLGTGVAIAAHFPEAQSYVLDGVAFSAVTFVITEAGLVETRNAIAADSASGANAIAECDDGFYAVLNPRWTNGSLPIRWKLDKRSAPQKIPRDKLTKRVKQGFTSWVTPKTACDPAGSSTFRFDYRGKTKKDPSLNGVNSVDFGPLGSSALALTYTYFVGSETLEFDIRLNKKDHRWTVFKSNKKRFQVRNAVAHEVGHALSLDDLGDPHGQLTMFARLFKGENKKSTLGRGDTLGVEDTSP